MFFFQLDREGWQAGRLGFARVADQPDSLSPDNPFAIKVVNGRQSNPVGLVFIGVDQGVRVCFLQNMDFIGFSQDLGFIQVTVWFVIIGLAVIRFVGIFFV